jgi:signal recognition particle subunit SEC65
MSTTGDLAVSVPQQSVWIPKSALLTSKDFAEQLRCLNVTQIEKTVVSKAGKKFGEIRDIANPKMITDWATLVLCDEDSKETKLFPKVPKKIRDDVMWDNAFSRCSEDQVSGLQPNLLFIPVSFENLGKSWGKQYSRLL